MGRVLGYLLQLKHRDLVFNFQTTKSTAHVHLVGFIQEYSTVNCLKLFTAPEFVALVSPRKDGRKKERTTSMLVSQLC